jgi:hypothetical protein
MTAAILTLTVHWFPTERRLSSFGPDSKIEAFALFRSLPTVTWGESYGRAFNKTQDVNENLSPAYLM